MEHLTYKGSTPEIQGEGALCPLPLFFIKKITWLVPHFGKKKVTEQAFSAELTFSNCVDSSPATQ